MRGPDIICCPADSWVKTIACLQMIFSALACAYSSVFLVALLTDNKEDDVVSIAGLTVLLVESLLGIVLGVVLLIGTLKEKLSCLWGWIIVTGFSATFPILSAVAALLEGDLPVFVSAMCYAVVAVFLIYIVHRRLREIEATTMALKNQSNYVA